MAGTKAHLSKLFYSSDSGTTYTLVAGVTQISKPTASKADIDMSDLQSTAMEYEKDIPDYGTASYSFNFDGTNATHQALLVLEASGATGQYKVELPENDVSTVTTFVYVASVESVDLSAARGGKQEATLNLRVTGAVTTAHGATAES